MGNTTAPSAGNGGAGLDSGFTGSNGVGKGSSVGSGISTVAGSGCGAVGLGRGWAISTEAAAKAVTSMVVTWRVRGVEQAFGVASGSVTLPKRRVRHWGAAEVGYGIEKQRVHRPEITASASPGIVPRRPHG